MIIESGRIAIHNNFLYFYMRYTYHFDSVFDGWWASKRILDQGMFISWTNKINKSAVKFKLSKRHGQNSILIYQLEQLCSIGYCSTSVRRKRRLIVAM